MSNDDLHDLPGPISAELTRLRAEREVFVADRADFRARITELENTLAEARTERDSLHTRLTTEHSAEHIAELTHRAGEAERDAEESRRDAAALHQELTVLQAHRDTLRTELSTAREERDAVRLRLLDAELSMAGHIEQPIIPEVTPHSPDRSAEIAELRTQIAVAEQELQATKSTVSWRVTAPLRAVRRKTIR